MPMPTGSASTRRLPLRVAVLGAGTVGVEVVCALLERPGELRAGDGAGFVLTGVAVRDVARAVARGIPAELVSDAPAHLVADDGADVIVELMGGDEPAHTLIAAALSMGKSVVTANKHVIAHHGPALEAIARRTGAILRYEAAVGGGIPILGPLSTDLAGNRITRVRGIVNGTTNHILTAMTEADPRDYATALADAQRLGYAEADPSGDVEGLDAANKLVILARLAFDRWLDPTKIPTTPEADRAEAAGPGITTVSLADQREAIAAGRIIRLIATAGLDVSGRIDAAVLPTAVPLSSPLGRTTGVGNRIEVDATPVGRVAFDGPGAGGPATSSAVLGDLIAIARGTGSTWGPRPVASDAGGQPVEAPRREQLRVASGIRYPIDD